MNRIDQKITGKSKRQQVVLSLSYRAAVVAPVRSIQRGWKEGQICRKSREDLGEIAVLSVRWSCGGAGTELWWWEDGSGWMVGVKSEDWKIEESKMNIVKSGPSWIWQVSGMRCAWLVMDRWDWQTLNMWAGVHMYTSTEYEYDNQFFELPFEQKITVLFLTVSNFCCQIQAFSDWITLSFYDQDGLVWSRNIPYAACSNSKFHQRYNKKVGDSLYRARVYANFSSSEKLQFLSMVSTWLC